MGDLRNKIAKIEGLIREKAAGAAWLRARGYEPDPAPSISAWERRPRCTVCGAEDPCVVQWGRWEPIIYRCVAHLPEWASYLFENEERQDRMCNLYSMTKPQAAIRDLIKGLVDKTGNLPPLPAVFPNWMAPVIRYGEGGNMEMLMMRWGFPPPNIPGQKSENPYLTNVRNTDSKFWRPSLTKLPQRCLVPVTSFAEPHKIKGKKAVWTWFAQDESRPLFFFAGIWREIEGDRGTKAAPAIGKHLVFSFLTTDASHDVAPVHDKATPVCLFNEDARDSWMTAPWEIARELQHPPHPGSLRIVLTGQKDDPHVGA